MIYFVGDLHFGHKSILKFEYETRGKLRANVEEMNEGLIEKWNETITKDDIVYNLGDFFFNMKAKDFKDIICRLNFKKMILIAGNHDHSKKIKKYQKLGIEVKYADLIKSNGGILLQVNASSSNDLKAFQTNNLESKETYDVSNNTEP